MGKINEISQKVEQSFKNNKYTTEIKDDVVEFDSNGLMFNFVDPVNVPSLRINGEEIVKSEPQVQSDWLQTDETEAAYIANKPTKLSDFINDGEGGSPADTFVTESEITDVIETTIEVNGLTIGIQGTSADVVTKLLGSDWRLPTLAEYQELLKCCTVGHTRQGGFDIPIVTSNTTHNILRFAYYNNNNHGSTRLTSNADYVDITKAATFYANAENWTASTATIDRYKKVAIRPVTDNPNLGVDMGCSSGVRWASRDLGATTDVNTGNQYAFGEITTKAEYTWDTYLCAQAECGTTEDPLSHVTKPITSTVLHKDNTAAHLNPVKEARWDGKQDALGFIPENSANKKTTLADNSDTYYPTQKAVKTAVDAKVDGPVSSTANDIPVYADETGKLLKGNTGVSIVDGKIIANGINISDAISTVKLRVNGGTFQVSIDGGLTWHTINFAD